MNTQCMPSSAKPNHGREELQVDSRVQIIRVVRTKEHTRLKVHVLRYSHTCISQIFEDIFVKAKKVKSALMSTQEIEAHYEACLDLYLSHTNPFTHTHIQVLLILA